VYCYASSVGLAGVLTLNAENNPNAVFIFKIGSTLITGSNSSVALINGAQQCNIFFQVGSSTTLGVGTQFVGNILALTSITLDTGANLSGRALARNGAVTLDTNTISLPTCASPPVNAPPTLTKSFSPASVTSGSVSTLTITLTNTNSSADPLTAPLIDTFPSGLRVDGTGTSTCGGSLAASNGDTNATLTGGSIPAAGSCTITVPVTGTSVGSFINSLAPGALETSDGGNSTPAIATLTITSAGTGGSGGSGGSGGTGGTGGSGGSGGSGGTGAGGAPTVGKSFSPATIAESGVSTVTLTLNNSDSTIATLTAPLTDSLPIGLMIDGVASTTCNGPVTAVMGGTSVSLTAGSIPAGGSCTVTVKVHPKCDGCPGNYYNSIPAGGLKTSDGNNTQAAVATLTVSSPPPAGGPPSLIKSFWPTDVVPGANTTLYIDLTNPDATAAKLTAPLVDQLPAGMTVVGNPVNNCGGTLTAVKGSTSVTLTGATIPINATCRITIVVSATTNGKPSAPGNYVNTLGIGVLKTSNGSNLKATSATLLVSLDANSGPTLVKSFSPAAIKEGQDSTLTLTLVNSAKTPATLTAPFSDHMPTGMVVAGVGTSTCGGVLTAVKGSSTVMLTGGAIPAGGTCKVTVPVTANCDSYWNEIAIGALQTSNGSNKESYGATLTVTLN
jgi:uncharacterized membrane protein YgcG